MPLRSDPSLWFNLPGVVAAYQPVAAPGPLLARYNQAHGGDNRYKAVDGVAPTWHGALGWTFDGTQWMSASGAPSDIKPVSAVATIIPAGVSGDRTILGSDSAGFQFRQSGDRLQLLKATTVLIGQTSTTISTVKFTGAVTYGPVGEYVFYVSGLAAGSGTNNQTLQAGGRLEIGSRSSGTQERFLGKILALVYFARTLSPAEVWTVSRQMQYCDANPDWSAWGRRRRWYFAPEQAAAYFRRRRAQLLGNQIEVHG